MGFNELAKYETKLAEKEITNEEIIKRFVNAVEKMEAEHELGPVYSETYAMAENKKCIDGKEDFYRDRSIVLQIGTASEDYAANIIPTIGWEVRDWGFNDSVGEWQTGSYAVLTLTLDSSIQNDPRIQDVIRRIFALTENEHLELDDELYNGKLYTTHSYEKHNRVSRPSIKAMVNYEFKAVTDFHEWRMFDWLERKCGSRYRLAHILDSECDRLPFPVIKMPRMIAFEKSSDATLFRLKWVGTA